MLVIAYLAERFHMALMVMPAAAMIRRIYARAMRLRGIANHVHPRPSQERSLAARGRRNGRIGNEMQHGKARCGPTRLFVADSSSSNHLSGLFAAPKAP